MREGIKSLVDLRSRTSERLGSVTLFALLIGTAVGLAFLFHWATGGWGGVWLLPITPVVLLLPLFVVLGLWPSSQQRFPQELDFPARFLSSVPWLRAFPTR